MRECRGSLWLIQGCLLAVLVSLAVSKSDEPSFWGLPCLQRVQAYLPRSSHSPLLTSAAFLISSRPLDPTHVSRQRRDWPPQVQRDRCVGMRTPTGTCNAARCAAVTVPRIPDRFLRQVGCVCVCGWWWTTFWGGRAWKLCRGDAICVSSAARPLVFSAPKDVSLSLIPTTWLLAPSYHPPPFSWETWSLILRTLLLQICLSCALGVPGVGGGGKAATTRRPGQGPARGVNHHRGCSYSSSLPFLFVFPRQKNVAL